MYTIFITNNHNLFDLWLKESLVKYQKVSKCYDRDCSISLSFVEEGIWTIIKHDRHDHFFLLKSSPSRNESFPNE